MNSMKITALCALVALAAYLAGVYDRSGTHSSERPGPAVTLATSASMSPAPSAGSPSILGDDEVSYVCPMHSHIVSDHEGECPICGMDLVKQAISAGTADSARDDSAHEHGAQVAEHKPSGAAIRIDPAVRNNIGVRVEKVVRGDLRRQIRTVGKISRIDPTARRNISPPTAGTVLTLSDKKEGDRVSSGELLFSIGSDELFALEAEYQAAMSGGRRDEALSLVSRLSEHGLDASQIAQLQGGAEPRLPAQVYAPQDGFVFIRRGEVGMAVTDGMMIYSLGTNSRAIEVIAEIYETQWGWVRDGQEAEMRVKSFPDNVFTGRITRVEPPVGYTTRTLEVRLRFDTGEEGLTQGMFSEVQIKGELLEDAVSVPAEAVIRTQAGPRVVLRRDDGSFVPVAVRLGEEIGDRMVVLSGLGGDETVVVSGQFLLDSESNRLAGLARLGAAPHTH
jgi:Cu(I)/Ag(I) efflux system membrane fusion protein